MRSKEDSLVELILAVIAVAKKDIVNYKMGVGNEKEARSAYRFVRGKDFEFYLNILNIPSYLYNSFRKKFFEGVLEEIERRKKYAIE